MNEQYLVEPDFIPPKRFPWWLAVIAAAMALVVLAVGVELYLTEHKRPTAENAEYFRSTAVMDEDILAIRLDISGMNETQIGESMLFCAATGYDTVFIEYSVADDSLLSLAVEHAYTQGLAPYVVFNIRESAADGFLSDTDLALAGRRLLSISKYSNLEGILFEGWEIYTDSQKPFSGFSRGYSMTSLCNAARHTRTDLCLGISMPEEPDQNTIPLSWLESDVFDYVMVGSESHTEAEGTFADDVAEWRNAIDGEQTIIWALKVSKAVTGITGWERHDQLLQQVQLLDQEDGIRFCADSFSDAKGYGNESIKAVFDYLTGVIDNKYTVKELTFSAPTSKNYVTFSSKAVFSGASDPEFGLTINGEDVERDSRGSFEVTKELELGSNTFVFSHNGLETTFNVTYKPVIITDVLPAATEFFDSGSSMTVTAVARAGSVVKATVGQKTVTLKQTSFYGESVDSFGEYYNFTGTIKLPVVSSDTNMGNIKFVATWKDMSETVEGATIGVYKRETALEQNFTLPTDDGYTNVGNKYIAEVVTDRTETFSGSALNDFSQPTNSYLPKGTVDYCRSTADTLFTAEGKRFTYRTLRYGKRVYTASENNGTEIKVYEGTLPETNTISVASVNETLRNTKLTLDVDWKAPFKLEMEPQKYIDDNSGEERPYYTVDNITYTYVDITFCYASKIDGRVNFTVNHPLFKSAEWIKNEADYTLRLHLRRTGSFYGWSAEYDEKGRLVFTFLHPAQLTSANNVYGVSLENAVILLDPGHGGRDVGATHGLANSNKVYSTTEATANLNMCLEMKRQLEALGAKVYLTRSNTSTYLSLADRTRIIAEIQPDVFVSIHHNWNKYSSLNGFESFYFTPMSWKLADEIYSENKSTGMYTNLRGNKWHTFFVTRVTDCPSALSENGFISGKYDYVNIITNASRNQERCAATVKGIVDYLKSIQPDSKYTPPKSDTDTDSSTSSKTSSAPVSSKNGISSVPVQGNVVTSAPTSSAVTTSSQNQSSAVSTSSQTVTTSNTATSSQTETSSQSESSSQAESSSEGQSSSEPNISSEEPTVSSEINSSREEQSSSETPLMGEGETDVVSAPVTFLGDETSSENQSSRDTVTE